MKFSTFIIAPLLAASCVSAHGLLRRISIQGKVFEGNRAGGPASPSVIRQVSSQDPNKGANNAALTCGPNSGPASLVADALPGDSITFDWRTASDGAWPHNIGPMLTYMASCGSATCDKFDQSNARWFKIDQVGRKPNSAEWVQNDLMQGGVASARIPQNLAPGNYLIRHEIIALHLGTSVGGAEFYPACAQLRVGGNGNGVPGANELVRIPGAYTDNDPGIFAPGVFDASRPYTFPGPAVATLAAGSPGSQGSPSSPPSSNPSPLTASPAPAPASQPSGTPQQPSPQQPQPSPQPPSPSPKTCRKKNRPSGSSSVPDPARTLLPASNPGSNPTPTPTPGTGYPEYRPRRLGHIMRRMSFENSFH